jgi:hypothetical protein
MNRKHRRLILDHINTETLSWIGETDSDGNPIIVLDGERHHPMTVLFDISPQSHEPLDGDSLSCDLNNWQERAQHPEPTIQQEQEQSDESVE